MARRYTREERREIKNSILNGRQQGLSLQQIADKLNDLGRTRPNGTPFTAFALSQFRHLNKMRRLHRLPKIAAVQNVSETNTITEPVNQIRSRKSNRSAEASDLIQMILTSTAFPKERRLRAAMELMG